MIEKNCWQGLDDFLTSITKALHTEGEEMTHSVVKRKSRKRRRGHSSQRGGGDDRLKSGLYIFFIILL